MLYLVVATLGVAYLYEEHLGHPPYVATRKHECHLKYISVRPWHDRDFQEARNSESS